MSSGSPCKDQRILIFHGYLLRGTGSNIYNASIARALVELGCSVHLLCQERQLEGLDFVDAVGDWRDGELTVEPLRAPTGGGSCTVYRPPIGEILPVYVADEYDGFRALTFPELTGAELEHYLSANIDAVRDVVESARPHSALANHLVMGPVVLARALDGVPYAVKIHGSALEYTVKPNPEFMPYAREGLAKAKAIVVGSRHTAESLWRTMDDDSLPGRTVLGPPGVDTDLFAPRPPAAAAAGLTALSGRIDGLRAGGFGDNGVDVKAAAKLARLDPNRDRIVTFVGKLIVSKGVDLLLAAWPSVLERLPEARLVVVGFGSYREGLERLLEALARGDLALAREIATKGRELEGGEGGSLNHLLAFLDAPQAASAPYRAAAARCAETVILAGRLDHAELDDLLPACELIVVPSTFPEAFGMVAIEGASCGAWPLVADHSGLGEVADDLAEQLPARAAQLLRFKVGDGAVGEIATKIVDYLELPAAERSALSTTNRNTVVEHFGWTQVARNLIKVTSGDLKGQRRVN